MKAKAVILVSLLSVGGAVLSLGYAQPSDNNNTAHVDIKGTVVKQNPTGWISAVFFQSNVDSGNGGVYEVVFQSTAPHASSCTATPDNSDLTGVVENVDAQPHQLLVSFRETGSSGGIVTPQPSAFTLSCLSN